MSLSLKPPCYGNHPIFFPFERQSIHETENSFFLSSSFDISKNSSNELNLPTEAFTEEYSYLRAYSFNKYGEGNNLLIPFGM